MDEITQARVRAIEHALSQYQGGAARGYVKQLLEDAHGDIAHALRLMKGHVGFLLGNFGYYGPGFAVACHGTAPTNPIEVWADGEFYDREHEACIPPTFEIPWRAVLEYVATETVLGAPAVQPRLV